MVIQGALQEFTAEVSSREFPGPQYSKYKIKEAEAARFVDLLMQHGLSKAASNAEAAFSGSSKGDTGD